MPLLYYWRRDNYRRDLDMGAAYHLNQANPLFHSIDLGDSLWAFTKNRDGSYALAAELIVKAKTLNPAGYHYGRYRLWGDLRLSRYFDISAQDSLETIIRALSCRTNARYLGQSFQGMAAVRQLTIADHQILTEYARQLPLEPRARLIDENVLELALYLDDIESLKQLVCKENVGIAEERGKYLFRQAYARNRDLVSEVQELYDGKCQICRWDPQNIYGQYLCQGHHLHWLSRGGEDQITNIVLLCPNHHQAIHRCDAPFDYEQRSFIFGWRKEILLLNKHIPA